MSFYFRIYCISETSHPPFQYRAEKYSICGNKIKSLIKKLKSELKEDPFHASTMMNDRDCHILLFLQCYRSCRSLTSRRIRTHSPRSSDCVFLFRKPHNRFGGFPGGPLSSSLSLSRQGILLSPIWSI